MKSIFSALLVFALFFVVDNASAQNNDDARTLVKQGMQLNSEKKYAEAIDKYTQALKADSGYLFAGYQLASSLVAINKDGDAIPYLKKIISANTTLSGAADDLLGLIYFRAKQYPDAEKYAIEAIKADPKHAGTQRMYALVAFHQNKRAGALLGFCSFILLEPNTPRSAEAFGNIQHILQGGELKTEPGVVASHPTGDDAALNEVITKVTSDAAKQKYASAGDLLTWQLKNIFMAVGQAAEKQTGNEFFRQYMAAYFYKLAQSPNMPAFARMVSQSTPESAKWITDHPQYMNDLYTWIKTTERAN